METEKVAFLLAGAALLGLIIVLFVKRRRFARLTVELMYSYTDELQRAQKVDEAEALFKVLLGYVGVPFMILWLIYVALY